MVDIGWTSNRQQVYANGWHWVNIKPAASLPEMEKWSCIRIRNPISTKIKLALEVHPLLPPTKFGGDPWTRSWDILRTKTVRTHRQTDAHTDRQTDRHTPMITIPCGLRRAGNKNVEKSTDKKHSDIVVEYRIMTEKMKAWKCNARSISVIQMTYMNLCLWWQVQRCR